MRLALVLAVLAVFVACDAQVDSRYPGEPLVRLHATAAGFRPDDFADAGAVSWNAQRDAALSGAVEALPIESAPPSSLSLLVLAAPPDDVYFGFDGEAPRLAEGALVLTRAGAVVGEAIDAALVFVDGEVAPGSLAADYLGAALAPGFHLRERRATAELTRSQADLAARCGGGDPCRAPRLYRLVATPADLATELVFFRSAAAGAP